MYLYYDIKGIQRFITSVPKLKCMIGASGIVAYFDEEVESLDKPGFQVVYAGGGQGAVECSDMDGAVELRDELLDRASEFALDVRIGLADDLKDAREKELRFYPYAPESLDGLPCELSGLLPIPPGEGKGPNKSVHPAVFHRLRMAQQDVLGRRILNHVVPRLSDRLSELDPQFFKTVSVDDDDIEDLPQTDEPRAGQFALGNRNRYALIYMDGNDIGRVFGSLERKSSDYPERLREMSHAMKKCTHEAFFEALAGVINDWVEGLSDRDLESCRVKNLDGQLTRKLILPFRPLVLGGDDLMLLCHASHAMEFVRSMSSRFNELSKKADLEQRWESTDGELTISAGILYSSVSFPLHMAMTYADELLEEAKDTYRRSGQDDKRATPAAVDWDHITSTLVDSPKKSRIRELCFEDGDLGKKISLTRRPYLLQPDGDAPDMESLDGLLERLREENMATTVLARLLGGLRNPWSERVSFIASIAKRHGFLRQQLWEDGEILGDGWFDPDPAGSGKRSTSILDAITLLEEEHRLESPTVGA